MTKDTKRVLRAILIMAVIMVGIDFAVGRIGDKLMDMQPVAEVSLAKDNYRMNLLESDVVILGPSRAQLHYVTQQLEDSINSYTHGQYTAYNAGINGRFVSSSCLALESILERYTPKLVVFEVAPAEFADDPTDDVAFSRPHYFRNPAVKRYYSELGMKENLKVQSALYRYNCAILRILRSFNLKENPNKGYNPNYNVLEDDHPFVKGYRPTGTIKPNSFNEKHFLEAIQACKQKGVLVLVCTSPYFYTGTDGRYIKGLCSQLDVPYFDMSVSDYFHERTHLFADYYHLNDDGAHEFTAMFADSIKPYLHPLMRTKP